MFLPLQLRLEGFVFLAYFAFVKQTMIVFFERRVERNDRKISNKKVFTFKKEKKMANYILGVKLVKHGIPTAEGGMATALDKQLLPYQESVTFEDEEGEVVKHYLQGARYPFLTIYNAAGTTFKFSVPMDNDNLKEWMGGQIVDGQWQSPRGNYQTVRSLELMTEFDIPISIPKATCYGVRKFGAKTTDVSLIEITAIVELPAKADEAPMMIGVKEPASQG